MLLAAENIPWGTDHTEEVKTNHYGSN